MKYLLLRFLLVWFVVAGPINGQDGVGRSDFNVADRLAILEVLGTYANELDNFNVDAWIAQFTEDAVFVGVDSGRRIEADRNVFERIFRERFRVFKDNGDQRRHIQSNVQFAAQTRDAAKVQYNAAVFTTNRYGPVQVALTIHCETWLVKRNGVWKIARQLNRNDTRLFSEEELQRFGAIQGVQVSDDEDELERAR